MPNRLLLALANQRGLARMALGSERLRPLVLRYVAGEQLEDAVEAVRALNRRSIAASLDHLGENVGDALSAREAVLAYADALRAIHTHGLNANVSVKLTSLGLDLGDARAEENLREVLDCAREGETFVRVDMEGSAYTARTLEIIAHVRALGYNNTGPVIQAYLYRSSGDVERAVAEGVRVRLCKGAYDEAPNVAFRRKRDTDRNYVRLMEKLLACGHYPAIATHDEAIIDRARAFAASHHIGPDRFEFQMLYGVRRDLQERLVAEGYNVRVYVPYGSQWYPYLVRRLAERPANVAFVLGNVVRERT